jgi:hypothetical protein
MSCLALKVIIGAIKYKKNETNTRIQKSLHVPSLHLKGFFLWFIKLTILTNINPVIIIVIHRVSFPVLKIVVKYVSLLKNLRRSVFSVSYSGMYIV